MNQVKVVCPHCNAEQEISTRLCTNCGTIMVPEKKPYGLVINGAEVEESKLILHYPILDVILGCIVSIILVLVYGIGILFSPLLYLFFRKSKPYFARGIIATFWLFAFILLGIFLSCLGTSQ
jgi:hypothetical protein